MPDTLICIHSLSLSIFIVCQSLQIPTREKSQQQCWKATKLIKAIWLPFCFLRPCIIWLASFLAYINIQIQIFMHTFSEKTAINRKSKAIIKRFTALWHFQHFNELLISATIHILLEFKKELHCLIVLRCLRWTHQVYMKKTFTEKPLCFLDFYYINKKAI